MTTGGCGRCLVLLCGAALSCAAPASPPASPGFARAPTPSFPDDPAPLPRYHSKRLALWLPLPGGPGWRIDDHSRPELEAIHLPTRSRIVVAVLRADAVVGRSQCEELAVAAKLVSDRPLQTVDDEVATTQRTFDTRIRVALASPEHEGAPLVGHVLAFGGYLRKCYVFDFSSRLAYARTRILGGLELDAIGASSRLAPADPELGVGR